MFASMKTAALTLGLLAAAPATAATFDVFVEGSITQILGLPASPSFVSAAPFNVGGSVNFTARIDTDAAVINPVSTPITTKYDNAIAELDGSFGGYTFEERPDSETNRNFVNVRGGPGVLDQVNLRRDLVGDNLGGYDLLYLTLNLRDVSAQSIPDNSLAPETFTDSFLTTTVPDSAFGSNIDQVSLLFASAQDASHIVFVSADVSDITATQISTVPLPTTGLLMLAGIGAFGIFSRRNIA